MDIVTLKTVLLYVTLINWGILLWWTLFLLFARNFLYRLHHRWFNLSEEQFNAIHYAGIAIYKLAIILFAFSPWLALVLAT